MSTNQKTRLFIASRDLQRTISKANTSEEVRLQYAAVLACEQRLARRRFHYGQLLETLLSGRQGLDR